MRITAVVASMALLCAACTFAEAFLVRPGQRPTFDAWAKAHGKTYSSIEEKVMRRSIWAANTARIASHNEKHRRAVEAHKAALAEYNATLLATSGATSPPTARHKVGHLAHLPAPPPPPEPGFTMSMNVFGDLTKAEFLAAHAGKMLPSPRNHLHHQLAPVAEEDPSLPRSIDWEKKGAVAAVKNQAMCGSCWAFSATGALEAAAYLAGGKLVPLSEQELVDCSREEGNMGCNGGLMDYAFEYVRKRGGLCSEKVYPYVGIDANCLADHCEVVPGTAISNYTDVTPDNERAFLAALAKRPLAVALEADGAFQFYSSGIFTSQCGTQLNHGVLAVGFGVDTSVAEGTCASQPCGVPYLRIKNSWSAAWGEAGYIRIARGKSYGVHGQCGVLMAPSYPIIDEDQRQRN